MRLAATAETAFEYLDDPVRLSAHMVRRSWKLAASRMRVTPDAAGGRDVGSHVTLSGTVLGYALGAELRICERNPPHCKVWETIGAPRLLVLGRYRMGFTLHPELEPADGTTLAVFIEFDPPAHAGGPAMIPFGAFYARWCVRHMLNDAVGAFPPPVRANSG